MPFRFYRFVYSLLFEVCYLMLICDTAQFDLRKVEVCIYHATCLPQKWDVDQSRENEGQMPATSFMVTAALKLFMQDS